MVEMTPEQRAAYDKAYLTCTTHWIPETAFPAGWDAHAASVFESQITLIPIEDRSIGPTQFVEPRQLTDAEIVEIRDEHLPSQGDRFDCIAFARALESRIGSSVEAAERQDALRYRWLRGPEGGWRQTSLNNPHFVFGGKIVWADELDAAIDAAIRARTTTGEKS